MKSKYQQMLTEFDSQLLQAIAENSRISRNKISKTLNTSIDTIQKHLSRLENEGILKGYTTIINPTKLGFSITAVIFVQIEGEHLLDVETEIAKEDNVLLVYDLTGEYDAAIVAKFKDSNGLNAFAKRLLSMRHVKRTVTNVAINVVKEKFNSILTR
jgi:Lrp/AsnC family transcriptional regulator for asnA, asnC and gidA